MDIFVSAKLVLVAILDVDVNPVTDSESFNIICSVFCEHTSKNMIARPSPLQTEKGKKSAQK